VEDAFGYVLFAVVVVAAIVAVLSLRGDRYAHVGRDGLFEDDPRRRPVPTGAVAAAERDEEIRQMVGARNARRARRRSARSSRPGTSAWSSGGASRSTWTPKCSVRSAT
jgi:hypothetical protein